MKQINYERFANTKRDQLITAPCVDRGPHIGNRPQSDFRIANMPIPKFNSVHFSQQSNIIIVKKKSDTELVKVHFGAKIEFRFFLIRCKFRR